eukprot:gnl/TRDRNA2_/TRDRNA2_172455_c0_seq1.p2 gnl/TRDRNA2_/TRDRNA2_172455_c0~~gnl/TRDRNA2_/TRDRNA2_172455_c0_seq1.p2  ORF type:complete len:119 (+),score=25.91 gnl/TRDRNA2_/TRDRNA2_172455_c0_seq1:160-516(+)
MLLDALRQLQGEENALLALGKSPGPLPAPLQNTSTLWSPESPQSAAPRGRALGQQTPPLTALLDLDPLQDEPMSPLCLDGTETEFSDDEEDCLMAGAFALPVAEGLCSTTAAPESQSS